MATMKKAPVKRGAAPKKMMRKAAPAPVGPPPQMGPAGPPPPGAGGPPSMGGGAPGGPMMKAGGKTEAKFGKTIKKDVSGKKAIKAGAKYAKKHATLKMDKSSTMKSGGKMKAKC